MSTCHVSLSVLQRVRLSEVELDAKLLSPRISIAEHMKVKLEASLQQHREQLVGSPTGTR